MSTLSALEGARGGLPSTPAREGMGAGEGEMDWAGTL